MGQPIVPPVEVIVLDPSGARDTTYNDLVAVTLASNPGGATLQGTTSTAAVRGRAEFGNLRISQAGQGYTLRAIGEAGSPEAAVSAPFDIQPPPPPSPNARSLAFTIGPSDVAENAAITPAVQVSALDSAGQTVTGFAGTVTITIAHNPSGGLLSGTTSVVAQNGVATFSNLHIDVAGSGYTLAAGTAGLSGATSGAFDVTSTSPPPPSATHLAFRVQPSSAQVNATITPAVQVAALDDAGNTVATFTGTVTVAIGANPGGGTLSGTRSVSATNGVATFSNLSIDQPGSGYTLVTSSSGLSGATSGSFDITSPPPPPPVATGLIFTVQPSSVQVGNSISPPVQVTAVDGSGNPVTSFTGTITVDLAPNTLGATLSGTKTVSAVNGVATFSDLSVSLPGVDYHLTAAFTGNDPVATSAAFTVVAP